MKLRNCILRSVHCCLSAIVMFVMTGCDPGLAGKWEYEEVGRIPSPDGLVETVITKGGAGATTSTVTSVYLVPPGVKVTPKDRESSIFDADHLKGFQLVWKEPKLLEIQYQEARILGFRNFWYEREVQNFRYVVEIRLAPAGTNFSLPFKDRNW